MKTQIWELPLLDYILKVHILAVNLILFCRSGISMLRQSLLATCLFKIRALGFAPLKRQTSNRKCAVFFSHSFTLKRHGHFASFRESNSVCKTTPHPHPLIFTPPTIPHCPCLKLRQHKNTLLPGIGKHVTIIPCLAVSLYVSLAHVSHSGTGTSHWR